MSGVSEATTVPVDAEKWQRRRLPWISVELVAILSVVYAITRLSVPSHDCALCIQCARLILSGKIPYVDFYEINPPLIMYLNVPHLVLGRLMGLSPDHSFYLFICVLFLFSLFALRTVVSKAAQFHEPADATILSVGWCVLTLYVVSIGSYGQREHIFVLGYAPFLILRWSRYESIDVSRVPACLIGFVAAVGAFLKPHFLAIVVLAELTTRIVYRRRKLPWTCEMTTIAAVGLAYAFHWFLIPGMLRGFLQNVHLVSLMYRYYDSRVGLFSSLEGEHWAMIVVALVAPLFYARWKLRVARLLPILSALSFAAFGSYLLQGKGWNYHLIPLVAFGILTVCMIAVCVRQRLCESLARRGKQHQPAEVSMLLCLIAACVSGRSAIAAVQLPTLPAPPLATFLERRTDLNDGILVLSTSVVPAYPGILLANRKPASHYLWTYPIALFAWNESEKDREAEKLEAQFFQQLISDIRSETPRLIIFPSSRNLQACPAGFEFREYLAARGALGTFFKLGYREVKGFPGYVVLEKEH